MVDDRGADPAAPEAEPGLHAVTPGSGLIIIAPVSVRHQVADDRAASATDDVLMFTSRPPWMG